MSSTLKSTHSHRRTRLLTVCTFTALSMSAFVLGPAALAQADSGAPHRNLSIQQLDPEQPSVPTPPQSAGKPAAGKLSGAARAAAAAGPDAPLYDADGDGNADVLVQSPTGKIMEWSSNYAIPSSKDNSTEYLDVLTPGEENTSASGPEVLSLTASGRLSLWGNESFPQGSPLWSGSGWQTYNKVVAVGDVTGDGLGDLLARTHTGDLYFYRGTGSSAEPFTARVKVGTGFQIFDQMTGAGDIAGTGHGSLVARDLDGRLWYYALDGNAATPVAKRVQIGTGWNAYNQIIGFPGAHPGAHGGLLGRTTAGGAYYYEGDPKGSGLTQLGARQDTTGTALPPGYWLDHYLVAGMGGNPAWGKGNLLGLTSAGDLYAYFSNADGTLSDRSSIGSDLQGARIVNSVSLEDSGDPVVMEIYNGTLYDDTVAGGANALATGFGDYNLVLGPGDLSGDGRSDLLARDSAGVLWLYPGKGDGTFKARVKVGGGWSQFNQLVGAGDFSGDGYADVVARDSSGTLYLYQGTGTASAPFKAKAAIGPGWNTYNKLAAPGDLDGDGKADLVGVNTAGELYRYSATGSAGTTFKAPAKIGNGGWNAYSWLQ
ncbi:VCBS repeat-containing protein [Streptomyces sp. NPDC048332]|uniref:FG-GAP repeat domain-containing protein n=1 Tax=Streptomyces sp. NPDC048332 TaxID=3154619 RepID=UPI0034344F82